MADSQWKKGRGKLGPLAPLIGEWAATADSPMGVLRCQRTFTRILNDAYIELRADWDMGGGRHYQEIALFGAGAEGSLAYWSFTSDGKRSEGRLADVSDIHPEAVGFEAQMPAGLARQIYWPDGDGGFHWAVESKTKKGWNRFTEHRYLPVSSERWSTHP